jgi:hypothetical protein
LEKIVRENVKNREHELVRCQEIINERATALLERFSGPPPKRAAVPDCILAGAPA